MTIRKSNLMNSKSKTLLYLVLIALTFGIVTPVLAAYLGPLNRTSESTKVVTYDYGVWAKDDPGYPSNPICNHKGGGTDCIVCTWKYSPGNPCGDAEYWYQLGTISEEVTTTVNVPPATISSTLQTCTLNNGWCNTAARLFLSGTEPVSGYSITAIEGTLNGQPFNCSGASCSVPLNEGNNSFTFWALSSFGDSSVMGTFTAKVDTVSPNVSMSVSGSSGSNGWVVSQPVVSATASDATSGINTILISDNGGPGKPGPVTLNNGVHAITVTATDNAGNSKSISQTVKVDTSGPIITPAILGTSGVNGWYRSAVDLSATGVDALAGMQGSVEVSFDNGISWTGLPIHFTDGIQPLILRAYDNAGNLSTSSLTLKIDSTPPTFDSSMMGKLGNAFWYVSPVTTSITSNDTLSGVDHVEYNQNGAGWQTGTSIASRDGVNSIALRVYDMAGNMASGSVAVKVDTVAPVITPAISGTAGSNGWLISSSTVSAAVNDATSGFNGESEVALDGGSTWRRVPVSLNDGEYNLTFRAFDVAGNQGSAVLNASIDTTTPTLNFVYTGTPGANGWYVSDVKVSTSASDALSDLDVAELRVDRGVWSSLPPTLSDGIYSLDAYAQDKAGNTKTISDTLRIDTTLPSSNYTSHTDNSLVSGLIHLTGTASDSNGLQAVEISLDGGVTWQATTLSSSRWSYDWNTAIIPNGTYILQIRSTDIAGNQENPVPLILVVDNLPPHVKITDFWWIWDSGEFHVSPNTFAVGEIKVTISDPKGRWPSVVFTYNPRTTSSNVRWDRRFSDGTIAPSGNYHASVIACDMYGNCASDRGVIHIPFIAPIPPTATSSPVPSPTPISTMTALPSPIPHVPTVVPLSPLVDPVEPIREQPIVAGHQTPMLPILAVVCLVALMWVLSSAALADPRPRAILEIAKTISQKRNL